MASTAENPCWLNGDLPLPTVTDYAPKGNWEQIQNTKTYITGSQTSRKAVVVIYDVFGASSQVLQGADRIAQHLNILVIMPDFFEDHTISHDEFVQKPTGFASKWQEFKTTYADVPMNVKTLLRTMPAYESRFPMVRSWGIFGLCWGGKVSVLAAIAENSPFKASGQTHPGLLAAEDAKALTTPHICMPSKGEPADVVAEYEKILTEKTLSEVVRFPNMFHGWMGARANLSDQDNLVEYEKGYRVAAEFFAKTL